MSLDLVYSTTASSCAWQEWNTTWTTWQGSTNSTSTNYVWQAWNGVYVPAITQIYTPPRTPEQEEAETKAEQLLREHLTEEQAASLDKKDAFLVSVKSGRRYKIKRGTHGNVREVDAQGKEIRSFCIQPADVPTADAMLAQKLMLEHDENGFHLIANARAIA